MNRWLLPALLGLLLAVGTARLPGADPAAPATNAPARSAAEVAEAERTLRSYLRLQEQLHAALLAIEEARAENTAAARTNADALANRLALIEKSLEQQRDQQAQSLHQSNRTLLTLGGTLIGVGFLSLIVMVVFQMRGMNRLAEMAAAGPLGPGFSPAALAAAGDPRLLGPAGGAGGADTARLHGVIERLERRIQELEGASRTAKLPAATIDITPKPAERPAQTSPLAVAPGPVEVLLGKGQALLSLGQHEGALRCFDDAIGIAPDHAEAHLRRGQTLERLKRLEEALASYDQALALDRSLTPAYLGKGSVFNQQERFGEALDCYEQALRSESAAS